MQIERTARGGLKNETTEDAVSKWYSTQRRLIILKMIRCGSWRHDCTGADSARSPHWGCHYLLHFSISAVLFFPD